MGRVFRPGEGEIGVKAIDRRFWTETNSPKETAKLFESTTIQKLVTERRLYSLKVAGDSIDVVFDGDATLLERMYQLALSLAHRLAELFW